VASTSNGTAPKPVRCAIYTRKSTEEGLNQDFNSLDAQREAAEAYIASQKHDGWTVAPTRSATAGTPARTSSGPVCGNSSPTSRPARSTAWSSTKSIA
jgi:hypothetical protein